MNMLYKKSLLKTAMAALLLTFTSSKSFAYGSILENESIDEGYSYYDANLYSTELEEEKSGNFYMSFNYNGVSPKMDSFSAKEDALGIETEKILSLDSNGKSQKGYNPEYKGGFAGNASIGYKTGNFRVELEGLASSATTDNKQIELESPRSSMINFDDKYDGIPHNMEIYTVNKDGHKDERIFIGKKSAFDHPEASKKYRDLIAANSNVLDTGFSNKAAMINAYYDINNSSNFIPYFGVGGGLTNVKFFGVSQIKPAMQGKLGLHYNISDKVQLSAGYRYFAALGNSRFSGIKLDNEIPTLKYEIIDISGALNEIKETGLIQGSTTATVESNFANHALEMGLKFNF